MAHEDGGIRFNIVNLGCKVNRVESDAFAAALLALGAQESDASHADLAVVNTCTVTGEADKKTRKAVRQALRANEGARVLVTGCAAAIDPASFEAMDERVTVVPKHDMPQALASAAGAAELGASDQDGLASVFGEDLVRVGSGFRTRVSVKVQDGCDNACTFCIVHTARGKAWSRSADQIVAEVAAHARAGVREIVLAGINLGAYAYDGIDLTGLLELLLEVAPDTRFRISSIEPHTIDDRFVELLARADGRVCRHLHLPLQSGSNKVLREMDRHYSADEFLSLVQRLYDAVPQLSLSTDVIVGFPGETEQDFQDTMELARACRFSKMHVFRYSMRAGTPAAARADQVSAQVKAARAHELDALSRELRRADRLARRGMEELVLVESDAVATSESYHTVIPPEGAVVGSLVPCTM